MSRSWSTRSRHGSDPVPAAAQAAQDGAVAAFLDLDSRQSYVADAVSALADLAGPLASAGQSPLVRAWATIAQQCLAASSAYLDAANTYGPTDDERVRAANAPGAQAKFTEVHRALADAAAAVDTFYRRHADELDRARMAKAAVPRMAAEAREAAERAEKALTAAQNDGVAYASVMDAAGQLINAVAALNAAEQRGHAADVRRAATQVQSAVEVVDQRISTAKNLLPTVRNSLGSVRTRIEVVGNKLNNLAEIRSALLREFAAASTADLAGADDRARTALERARAEFAAAEAAMGSSQAEGASSHLGAARAALTEAEATHAALTDRLTLLRQTKADPKAASEKVRFRIRDAQRLVVGKDLVREWGSVLDAQVDRVTRAQSGLVGPHPDYWAYLQALHEVDDYVHTVVDRVRAAGR